MPKSQSCDCGDLEITCKAYKKNTIPKSLNDYYCEKGTKKLTQTLIFIINGPLFG